MISRIKAGLDNRANPIMIKEMYQAVHSRLFMNAFLVLPLAALLIYTIAYPLRSNEPPGAIMFALFMWRLKAQRRMK